QARPPPLHQRRVLFRQCTALGRPPTRPLPRHLRRQPRGRLDCACAGAVGGQSPDPPTVRVRWPAGAQVPVRRAAVGGGPRPPVPLSLRERGTRVHHASLQPALNLFLLVYTRLPSDLPVSPS